MSRLAPASTPQPAGNSPRASVAGYNQPWQQVLQRRAEGAQMDERAWPHPIIKPESEWTEFDRDYIDLLRAAHAEGYCPREGPCGCVDLGHWSEGRSVSLVRRGLRNGWEPFLGGSGRSVRLGPTYGLGENACVCVRPPFRAAAHLSLEWMRGRSLERILGDFDFVGGSPPGIILSERYHKMKTLVLVAEHGNHRYEIVEGNGEGFYVFRYADLRGPQSTHDYLQDDLDRAKRCAQEEFGVDRSAWRPAATGEQPAFRKAGGPL